jgi:hypothetical protein
MRCAVGWCPAALFLTLRDDLRILGSLSEGGAVAVKSLGRSWH